ncbi:transposase [Streptomyces sp. AM2-3-1]|nr:MULTISPECIES: transposase [unclassified Streptomyces]WNO70075.1 transposase [Streptomyces sp. AM2-3-1]
MYASFESCENSTARPITCIGWCTTRRRLRCRSRSTASSASARYLRAEYTGRINRIGMGPVFWSRSYFAGSCGGAPLTVIRQHIEGQKRPV